MSNGYLPECRLKSIKMSHYFYPNWPQHGHVLDSGMVYISGTFDIFKPLENGAYEPTIT